MTLSVCRAKQRLVLSTTLALLLSATAALAQSPGDDFIRRQNEQDLNQRLDMLRMSTPKAVATQPPAMTKSGPLAPGTSCFAIRHVAVDGITRLSAATLAPVLSPYHDRCIALSDIQALLKNLTALYMDSGYVAARVYVPEQDIAGTGELRLTVAEGTLSDIYLNGKPATAPGLLQTAFPGLKGHPVNMRDVEQGIDQINRLSSSAAKTTMLPGQTPASSILNVENTPGYPWHFTLANNNLGQKSTGYSKSSISFRMDNLVNLNDLLALTFEHTGPDYPVPDDGAGQSNSLSGSLSIPYGYSTFTLNGSYYKYRSTVASVLSDYDTSGKSGQFGLNVDRVIRRDAASVTTLNAGLTYKQTTNFMQGDRIDVGSRQYTVASLGLSHSRRMLGGLWVFDLSYSQGLGIFGATGRGDPGAGDAEPQFSKFTGTINVSMPFELAKQKFQFATLFNGQMSPDNLYGAEQISLGGYSNVRGPRDSVLFGNNGGFIRNELTWRTVPWAQNPMLSKRLGELRPYAALDYGHVFAQNQFGIEGGNIAGWTLGVRLAGGNIGADIGYSRLLTAMAPASGRDLLFVNTSLQW
jgi:hemolysin activation/secretion protein